MNANTNTAKTDNQGRKIVHQDEFNKQVEIEFEWVRRHEYENDERRAWSTAKYRTHKAYVVNSPSGGKQNSQEAAPAQE